MSNLVAQRNNIYFVPKSNIWTHSKNHLWPSHHQMVRIEGEALTQEFSYCHCLYRDLNWWQRTYMQLLHSVEAAGGCLPGNILRQPGEVTLSFPTYP